MMRILFITSTYLGDALLSTGILDHLEKRYPQARFYIACGPVPAPLFDALPRREKTYIMRKKPFSFHWFWLWLQCIFKPWHLVVDMRGSLISYGLFARYRKIWHAPSSHTLRVHQIAQWFDLPKTPFNKVWTMLQDEKSAQDLLPEGFSYVAFSPTANWDKKCWPLENFISLGQMLLKNKKIFPKAKILVLGTADQRKDIEPLFKAFGDNILDLMGKPSLPSLFCCLSRCKVFIGNDSGLMHLAATANTPTIGLFGPSPVKIYGPWGKKQPLYPYLRHKIT